MAMEGLVEILEGGAAYYNERSAGARRVYKVIIDLCHGTAALLKFDQTQE